MPNRKRSTIWIELAVLVFACAPRSSHAQSGVVEGPLLPQSSPSSEPYPSVLLTPPKPESTGDVPLTIEQRLAELEAKVAGQEPQFEECIECEPESEGSKLRMTGAWNHGLEFKTEDESFRVHVGGRTQFDSSWYAVDQNVEDNINRPYENGVDFRRARLRVDGLMYSWIDWAVEYDFINAIMIDGRERAVTAPTDLWFTFRDVPYFGHIRVGNQKPAIGFEHLVSSRFQPFMERSFNQDTFYGGTYNGFLPGISLFNTYDCEMGTWNLGLFKPTDNVFAFNATDGDYFTVARLTRLLVYECEGARLLHVGGSIAQQSTVRGRMIFRTRDAIRSGLAPNWPIPASTGEIAGDDVFWANAELAAVAGPFTFQSEYLVSSMTDAAELVNGVPQPSVGTVNYHGGYIQMLYYLTPDHDHYDKLAGIFARVTPHENAICSCDKKIGCVRRGTGAWQVGLRYNYLDLNDQGIDGGILHNVTAGVNWFLNPNMKIQFDYFATHRDAALANDLGDGWINGWGVRFAQDF